MISWTEAAAGAAFWLTAGLALASCAREQQQDPPSSGADSAEQVPPPQPLPEIVSAARGFPAMWTLGGARLADGAYACWVENDLVHIELRYDFQDGRRVVEETSFATEPRLEQRTWRWTESRADSGRVRQLRRFEADFRAGSAASERLDDGRVDRDDGQIAVEPGKTFAGFGFTLALQSLRDRLVEGAVIELQSVAFVFGPRTVDVEVTHAGIEHMRMGGRDLTGDRFDIIPQIPWLVDLFVEAPTSHIWLFRPPPTEFLRFEGPLVEPQDPRVRIDLLPGIESSPAEPERNTSP